MTDMMQLPEPAQVEDDEDPAPAHSPAAAPGADSARADRPGGRGRRRLGPRRARQARRLTELARDPDPSIAMSGQVGSQIKIEAGARWLLANVRNAQDHRRRGRHGRRRDRLPRRGRRGKADRAQPATSAAASPAIRSPARKVYPGDRRRLEADVRLRRARPYRDRHRLSDQRHARRASTSTRCSASISRCSARPAPASRPAPR